MGWSDAADIQNEFAAALETFDWTRVDELCRVLVDRLRRETEHFPERGAEKILERLRRKRRFQQMASLAETFTESGIPSPRVALLYAQALIERGYFTAAERLVNAPGDDEYDSEVSGLKGRIAKQRYVNCSCPRNPRYRSYLQHATAEYLRAYRKNPANYWHAINVVALICRARRDGIPTVEDLESTDLARRILAGFAPGTEDTWQLATRLEAQLALGDLSAIEAAALHYASSDADAFEIASTLRQLIEVWNLVDSAPPGSRILPILRAALLRREGGGIRLSAETASADLEKVFGRSIFNTLKWYQMGLDRCGSIARIETRAGAGHGTGWLLAADDVFERKTGDLFLITNAHVVGSPGALAPHQVQVDFRMTQAVCEIDHVVWFSPVAELDTTIAKLKTVPPGATGLPLSATPPSLADPPPRLYVIGHPGGRDLEFSLQDNVLLNCNGRLLHYRTPTEGGSSGSPVFEDQAWQVVALHHAGKADMKRLGGEGTYEANEGISIRAICDAFQRAMGGNV